MVAAILSDWGYNAATILAGLGVGGLAIALAAPNTIENLFGGVAVISDRPVSVGDLCRFGDRVGTVEDIGLRSTRIRTLDRTLVTIPNAEFSAMTLENLSKRDKIWFHFVLNLRRDTTPDQVRTLLEYITRTLREHPKVETGPLPVRFIGVGAYSLDLELFAYVLTRNMDDFLRIQQELILWVLEAVDLGYHLKTGHTLSLQNRPTDFTQDTKMLYRAGRYSGKSFFDGRRPRAPRRGIAQGGFQRSALKSLLRGEARCLRRGGNSPRPGLPLGETGKGDQIPCCRRLISWFGVS